MIEIHQVLAEPAARRNLEHRIVANGRVRLHGAIRVQEHNKDNAARRSAVAVGIRIANGNLGDAVAIHIANHSHVVAKGARRVRVCRGEVKVGIKQRKRVVALDRQISLHKEEQNALGRALRDHQIGHSVAVPVAESIQARAERASRKGSAAGIEGDRVKVGLLRRDGHAVALQGKEVHAVGACAHGNVGDSVAVQIGVVEARNLASKLAIVDQGHVKHGRDLGQKHRRLGLAGRKKALARRRASVAVVQVAVVALFRRVVNDAIAATAASEEESCDRALGKNAVRGRIIGVGEADNEIERTVSVHVGRGQRCRNRGAAHTGKVGRAAGAIVGLCAVSEVRAVFRKIDVQNRRKLTPARRRSDEIRNAIAVQVANSANTGVDVHALVGKSERRVRRNVAVTLKEQDVRVRVGPHRNVGNTVRVHVADGGQTDAKTQVLQKQVAHDCGLACVERRIGRDSLVGRQENDKHNACCIPSVGRGSRIGRNEVQ